MTDCSCNYDCVFVRTLALIVLWDLALDECSPPQYDAVHH